MFSNPDNTIFKNDVGHFLSKALFYETSNDPSTVLYTLKDDDYEVNGKILPSLRKAYLEMEDVTEYLFATKYFYNWDHWIKLVNSSEIGSRIAGWRNELHLKLTAKYISLMKIQAETPGKDGLSAQKYLLERSWEKSSSSPKKSKNPVIDLKEINRQLKTDYERINPIQSPRTGAIN